MKFPSHYPAGAPEARPVPHALKIPRIDSLHHRVRNAKDADGKPIPLLDELFFFLSDPPPGTGDRWQKGADLCARNGIKTSRMSVWRFYRAHLPQWNHEQNPTPPEPPLDVAEITRRQEQFAHLVALRALDLLNDPKLTPGQLIGLLQSFNHGRRLQLERDKIIVRRDIAIHQAGPFADAPGPEDSSRPSRLKMLQPQHATKSAVTAHTTS